MSSVISLVRRVRVAASVVAVLMTAAPIAGAVILIDPVGPATFADTVVPGVSGSAGGGTVLATTSSAYSVTSGGQTFKGLVVSSVVQHAGTGTLDFLWRIVPGTALRQVFGAPGTTVKFENVPTSTGPLTSFRISGFGPSVIEGDWRSDLPGPVRPQLVRQYASGDIDFLFTPGVGPADASRTFFLTTNSTQYNTLGSLKLQCAGANCPAAIVSTFAPVVSVVPEPAEAGLVGLGLASLVMLRSRLLRARRT